MSTKRCTMRTFIYIYSPVHEQIKAGKYQRSLQSKPANDYSDNFQNWSYKLGFYLLTNDTHREQRTSLQSQLFATRKPNENNNRN